MRSFKHICLISAAGLALTACGGGGGSDTSISFDLPATPVGQSQYDIQTKAAQDAFEKRLSIT